MVPPPDLDVAFLPDGLLTSETELDHAKPIEEAFSKRKALLRREKTRTKEALVEAIGRALVAITPGDALGWFGHCGYPLSDRSL